jgi:hypothetical protein
MKTSASLLRIAVVPLLFACCRHNEAEYKEEWILEVHSLGEVDYQVYDAVLSDLINGWSHDYFGGPVTWIVLCAATEVGLDCGDTCGTDLGDLVVQRELVEAIPRQLVEAIPAKASSMVERFASANRWNHQLENRFEVPVSVTLLTKDEIDELFRFEGKTADPWVRFRTRYPGGLLVHLSAVGFNPDTTYALAYAGSYRRALAGAGVFYLLRRERSSWVLVVKETVWVE